MSEMVRITVRHARCPTSPGFGVGNAPEHADRDTFPETIDLARIFADIDGEQDGLEADGRDESLSPPVRPTG